MINTNNNGETLELKQNNDAFLLFFLPNKVANRYLHFARNNIVKSYKFNGQFEYQIEKYKAMD